MGGVITRALLIILLISNPHKKGKNHFYYQQIINTFILYTTLFQISSKIIIFFTFLQICERKYLTHLRSSTYKVNGLYSDLITCALFLSGQTYIDLSLQNHIIYQVNKSHIYRKKCSTIIQQHTITASFV